MRTVIPLPAPQDVRKRLKRLARDAALSSMEGFASRMRRPAPPPTYSFLAVAVGAVALGAFAIGALAIGRLAIGRATAGDISVRRARIGRLEVDDLVVRNLTVVDRSPGSASGP
jgi:hypothetical protein